jgi:ribosomal protein L37AE/L43A
MDKSKEEEVKLKGICTACRNSFPLSSCKKHFFYCSKILNYLTNGAYNPLENSNVSKFFTSGYVLKIVDNERPQTYFSFITAPCSLSLKDLDTFLKAFWCHCCSHMSCFIDLTTQKEYFPYLYSNSSFPNYEIHDLMSNYSIEDVFNSNSTSSSPSYPSLLYEYDFSENRTTLFISVVEKIVTTCPKNRFTVLIQNEEPHYCCENCSENQKIEENEASIYCSNCCKAYCNDCLRSSNNRNHLKQCDSSCFLPVVNSPRVGKCCYQGQSVFSTMDPLNLRFEEFNLANNIKKEDDQEEGINKKSKGGRKKIHSISMETSPTSIHSIHSVSCDDIMSKEVK